MKRFVLTVSIAALASVFLMTGPAMSENLKIGSMSPLTGPYAADGNDRHRRCHRRRGDPGL